MTIGAPIPQGYDPTSGPNRPANVTLPQPTGDSSGGTGQIKAYLQQLQDLKSQVQGGKLNITDYSNQADAIVKQASSLVGSIAKGGSNAANSVNPIWQQFQDLGFVKNQNGQWATQVPFSRSEYAQLPENVLPTQDDVTKGLFDPNTAPFSRFRSTPAATPSPTDTPPVTPGSPGSYKNPNTPDLSSIPTNIDLSTDRGQIESEAAREAQQQTNALSQATQLRTQNIGSLGDLLQKQNQAQFNYDLPGIKEDLASSGLFSSPSALAAAVARESGMLGANTTAQLGQYGISNIDQQAAGIQNIANQQNQLQQGALQRQFSTGDFQKQLDLARQIGGSVPQAPGQSVLGSALGGGATGAMAAAPLWAANPGLGAAMTAAGAAAGASNSKTSYICLELIRRGLAIDADLDNLHIKIMPAMLKKGRAFWIYAMDAGKLVDAANKANVDWTKWKKRFLDDVLNSESSVEAVNSYALACRDLAFECDPSLWDERALRVGYFDSLRFLPRLFTYKPFLKALVKVLRMKIEFLIKLLEVSHGY